MFGSVRLPIYPVYTLHHFTSEYSNLQDTQLTCGEYPKRFPESKQKQCYSFLHLLLNAAAGLSDM